MSAAKELEKARHTGMTQGIAYCVAMYLKYWGDHPWVDEVWGAAGMTMEECRQIVDEYDMETLEQYADYLKEIEDKKNK